MRKVATTDEEPLHGLGQRGHPSEGHCYGPTFSAMTAWNCMLHLLRTGQKDEDLR